MYVKSLTLKGFKSFASATNLKLEPGITCIVGPNGSGKSNVVDALAWVMGEGSARTLRGGKMDDVIFAGTAGRPALGRAEVTMTIDNSDGALPIDYSEVTISRTMFRGGGSEYAINRTPCRLLDIQELLSDSGIGREMHVIVGQGQLDAVLRATPEERRGFIEEAAGVLKHRRRKEKALRKLDAMEGNLTRVADLTAEVRRQLGPLGRQAETARRAQSIQVAVRDARLRLLADDLLQQQLSLNADLEGEAKAQQRRAELETQIERAQAALNELEQAAAAAEPKLQELVSAWYDLSAVGEKLSATARLAQERARLLSQSAQESKHSGRDPEQMRAQAHRLRGEELELEEKVRAAQEALDEASAKRQEVEQAHAAEQQRLVRLARAAADRREGLAKLQGQVEVRRSRTEAGQNEITRLTQQLRDIKGRHESADAERAELVAARDEASSKTTELQEAAQQAAESLDELTAARNSARDARNTASQRRAAAAARVDALEMMLGSLASQEALPSEADGLVGELVEQLTVKHGHEAAVNVALGWAASALVVTSHEAATRLFAALKADKGPRVGLVVADAQAAHGQGPAAWPTLPEESVWVRDVVTAPAHLQAALAALTDRLALVPDADGALAVVEAGARAVTADGDLYAPTYLRGGGRPAQSALEVRAALDEAREEVSRQEELERHATQALTQASDPIDEARTRANDTRQAVSVNESETKRLNEQIARHDKQRESAGAEEARVRNAIEQAQVALESNRMELEELELRLEEAEAMPADQEPSTQQRDDLAERAAAARTRETELRLTLRTRQEQVRHLAGRADSLEAGARSEEAAQKRAVELAQRRRRSAAIARQVAAYAETAQHDVVVALEHLGHQREQARAEKATRDAEIVAAREQLTTKSNELREVTDAAHRDEVARTQQRLRIEALELKAREEHGIEPDALLAEYGPDQPIPVLTEDGTVDLDAEPQLFERDVQVKRLRAAERDLKQLGKVNPLALEEYAALEERHTFLSEQLRDLRASKKDLLSLVAEVDKRVEEVFTEAFTDVAREFTGVFERLFPGGEGRLVLTDPDSMLTTGLDVEARPPGKKIKRLSLLSGGERSLVAVALLVSIFKARPSPFYIMDEVEAALDDANLSRLITLFEELRDSSQLIVITHQKRTMEVADALYGVTMRGDGVTTVVSQRLADVAPASMEG